MTLDNCLRSIRIEEGNDEPTVVRRPLLVTIPEAAQMLAVGRSTTYQLIWTEQRVTVRFGRHR